MQYIAVAIYFLTRLFIQQYQLSEIVKEFLKYHAWNGHHTAFYSVRSAQITSPSSNRGVHIVHIAKQQL
jgi:hypothetical protein